LDDRPFSTVQRRKNNVTQPFMRRCTNHNCANSRIDFREEVHDPAARTNGERNVMLAKAVAIGIALLPIIFAGSVQAGTEANTVTCTLAHAGNEFAGTCAIPCSVNALAIDIDGPNPKRACDAPPRTVQAALRQVGGHNWLGAMQGKFPEDPTRFELVTGDDKAPGIAKTPFGWFALQDAREENDSLKLSIAANNQLPPTQDDIRIIQRARALLSDEKSWNRADNRTCPPNLQTWSLFCALEQATQEISGGVHYRQPALQMAREVLNEVGGSRLGKHRLMDYNNHQDTTLAEVHALLDTAQARLEKRLRQ
jgi:hypothetical protein